MWGNKLPPIQLSCLRKLEQTRQRRIRHLFCSNAKRPSFRMAFRLI
ncbi:hypothetical protein HMPREF1604_03960 [Escherichia coli 908519]|nr:hypothetical protein HMPREF1604_03960 [Escherichia coli 908519]